MKIILGINYKFFELSPKDLFNLIETYDKDFVIEGFEVGLGQITDIGVNLDYITKLASLCKEKNYIFNIHSPIFGKIKNSHTYLDFLNVITNNTNIVMHLLNNTEEHLIVANGYLDSMLKYIENKNYNIQISLENLNIMNGKVRTTKEDIMFFLEKYPNLKFTYDWGHEIIDGVDIKELPKILADRLNNVHIHSYKNNQDHYPIEDMKKLKELINILNNINYKDTIVLEYSVDYIEGNTLEEKFINYINHAKEINKVLGENKND